MTCISNRTKRVKTHSVSRVSCQRAVPLTLMTVCRRGEWWALAWLILHTVGLPQQVTPFQHAMLLTHINARHGPSSHVQHDCQCQVIACQQVLVKQSRHDLVDLGMISTPARSSPQL
jgi:hypothetical protein